MKCPQLSDRELRVVSLSKDVRVIAGRRQYHAELKTKVVLEVLSGEKTPSEIYRTHKLNINVLNH
jgi:transposase-like protein